MEQFSRLAVYIISANIAYLIFSLFRQGFKHYSNYIAQLLFLLIGIFWLLQQDIAYGWVLLTALSGIFILVILPIFLQGQIDGLMEENRYDEVEPFARLKAAIAWSYPNAHLQDMAEIASEYYEVPMKMIEKLRELLGKGEPYDGMTRLFLGLIHFNSRNFNELINDLKIKEKDYTEQSFEELLYLVRAYLETTRYDEAIEAQLALEKKVYENNDGKSDRKVNASINRFVFYAFMGWKEEYDAFLAAEEDSLNKLPQELREFWRGVCYFYSGDYNTGEKQMQEVINKLPEEALVWKEFMEKRYSGMVEHKNFFNQHVLPKLKELHDKYNKTIEGLIKENEKNNVEVVPENKATNALAFLISVISVILIVVFNVNDSLELINMGASSAFLVGKGEYFRLVSYIFIHMGWLHLLMNLVALRYFGPPIESIAGKYVFLLIFFGSGMGGAALSVYMGNPLTIGASGGVLGLLSAAIVFELFKLRGVTNFSNQASFSTLVFILGINLALGYFESGIDNSAHFGGLITGAILALAVIPAIKIKKLKHLANGAAIVLCLGTIVLALWQHISYYNNSGFYPKSEKDFVTSDIASCSFKIDFPASWKIEKELATFQELTFSGPFREKLIAIVGLNLDEPQDFFNKYIPQKSNEFESENNLELVSVAGPEKLSFKKDTYRIKWLVTAYEKPVVIDEYLNFENGFVKIASLIVSSKHTDDYSHMIEHSINSMALKVDK